MRNEFRRVAVVGAGISGLICARSLADHGVPVTVFEKSRGVGGRMATRRAEGGLTFDHGAQYFTVGDEQFGRHVRSWQQDGLVELWDRAIRVLRDGCVEPLKTAKSRFVGTPGMTAVCKHLAKDVDVHLQREVAELQPNGNSWCPVDAEGSVLGTYDVMIVSAPSLQSARLLEPDAKLSGLARQVTVQPCWAVMAAFDSRLPTDFDGAFIHDASLSWAARNSRQTCTIRCGGLLGPSRLTRLVPKPLGGDCRRSQGSPARRFLGGDRPTSRAATDRAGSPMAVCAAIGAS